MEFRRVLFRSLLLVAGFFAWQAWRVPESTEPLRAVPLTTLPGVARYPSFSADGNYMAFAWTAPRQENTDVSVQQIGAGPPSRLRSEERRVGKEGVSTGKCRWSPDHKKKK